MDKHAPRPEYPRPQFKRDEWLCLNGEWQFEIDDGDSGLERGLLDRKLDGRIVVPFCPESILSGVGNVDFMRAVWYRRAVRIPREWSGKRILLHFQAVDYDATVWVNGKQVGRHRGGFTPFACDITAAAAAEPGESATIVLRARDFNDHPQPRGKQSRLYRNHRCVYTRTTGIWQTVWMEPVAECSFKRPRITPDVANSLLHLEMPLDGPSAGLKIHAALFDEKGIVSESHCAADADFAPMLDLAVPPDRRRLWSPGDPHLYDMRIRMIDGDENVIDCLDCYAGLRSVSIDGAAVLINGEPIFQRLVLDQGYYPDGIMTAPTEEALRRDIELSMAAGFNGARLHQKVFEERFLCHADRMGYLVWGEFADWGCAGFGPADDPRRFGPQYVAQWLEALERDYSHPGIIGWCPLNETGQPLLDRITELDDVTAAMFLAAKAADRTRPVLDTSGYSHRIPQTDVFDCHDYDQDPEQFRARHDAIAGGKPYCNGPADAPWSIPWRGQPFFVSEFGGAWWNPTAAESDSSWGYGKRPGTIDEFYSRFEGLCSALLENPLMFGYCYTQLTDVFQEQNGIYNFDRSTKFDAARLAAIQRRPAAIEKNL